MRIKDFFRTEQFKELLIGFLISVLQTVVKTNFTTDKNIKEITNNHIQVNS